MEQPNGTFIDFKLLQYLTALQRSLGLGKAVCDIVIYSSEVGTCFVLLGITTFTHHQGIKLSQGDDKSGITTYRNADISGTKDHQ